MTLAKAVSMKYNKTIEKCSNEEIYYALLDMTKQMAEDKVSNEGKKKLYYISAEFLIGKLLSNNLINLGIYDSVKSELEASKPMDHTGQLADKDRYHLSGTVRRIYRTVQII